MSQVQVGVLGCPAEGKHRMTEIMVGLKEQLDNIERLVWEEASDGMIASRLRILVGMWEKGEAIVRFIGGVKTGWTYHSMMMETGKDEKALKKWHELYVSYPEKEVYIEKVAKPRAELWAQKCLFEPPVKPAIEHIPLPEGVYDVIYADPPWQYNTATTTPDRVIETKYPTQTLDWIKSLAAREDWPIADDSVLFLWVTAPLIIEGLEVLEAWGYKYKSQAVWDKEIIGLGYWFRGQHELLLVGSKGNIRPPEESARYSSVIRERRGKHSKKPEIVYKYIEDMFPGPGRYIELFARNNRPGWASWGNEVL